MTRTELKNCRAGARSHDRCPPHARELVTRRHLGEGQAERRGSTILTRAGSKLAPSRGRAPPALYVHGSAGMRHTHDMLPPHACTCPSLSGRRDGRSSSSSLYHLVLHLLLSKPSPESTTRQSHLSQRDLSHLPHLERHGAASPSTPCATRCHEHARRDGSTVTRDHP